MYKIYVKVTQRMSLDLLNTDATQLVLHALRNIAEVHVAFTMRMICICYIRKRNHEAGRSFVIFQPCFPEQIKNCSLQLFPTDASQFVAHA